MCVYLYVCEYVCMCRLSQDDGIRFIFNFQGHGYLTEVKILCISM